MYARRKPARLFPALAPLVLLSACAHAPVTYRLTQQAARPLLIPPGVAQASVSQRTFVANVTAGGGKCGLEPDAVALQRKGRRMRITVSRDALAQKPAAWVTRWAGEAETRGCIAPGEARRLAAAIVEAVPLDPEIAFRLVFNNNIQAGYIDLGPASRLEVVAPILDSGAAAPDGSLVETQKVSGEGNRLQLDLKLSPSVRGFETSIYAVEKRSGSDGFLLAPVSVKRNLAGRTEPAPAPLIEYLKFPRSDAFFRLIYKTEDNGVKAVVLGAATQGQLTLDDCDRGATCVTLPKSVAINPVVAVTVNGVEMTFGLGMRIWNAVMAGGVRQPPEVLPTLQVWRPYGAGTAPVEFDRTSQAILNLKLAGGERIAWQTPPAAR